MIANFLGFGSRKSNENHKRRKCCNLDVFHHTGYLIWKEKNTGAHVRSAVAHSTYVNRLAMFAFFEVKCTYRWKTLVCLLLSDLVEHLG